MSPQEAEKIINDYGKALVDSGGGIARKKSLLPCTKGKIRLAFFIYIKELVNSDLLDEKIGGHLTLTYASVDAFVADNIAKRINKLGENIKAGTENEKKEYLDFAKEVAKMRGYDEINEYIFECQKNKINL